MWAGRHAPFLCLIVCFLTFIFFIKLLPMISPSGCLDRNTVSSWLYSGAKIYHKLAKIYNTYLQNRQKHERPILVQFAFFLCDKTVRLCDRGPVLQHLDTPQSASNRITNYLYSNSPLSTLSTIIKYSPINDSVIYIVATTKGTNWWDNLVYYDLSI